MGAPGMKPSSGDKTMHIEPASRCENGYLASFNGHFRDDLARLSKE
jgi:hypothetical protein